MRTDMLGWIIGFLTLLGLCSCGQPKAEVHPNAPIILISVDTLRADHLPAYGYNRVATPALDALAADSVVFERAFAQAPLTLPSHASLMTGLLPPRNGVRENVGFRLHDKHQTLAEILGDNGYHTGAFISSMVLRQSTGVAQGFQTYDDSFGLGLTANERTYPERPGGETLELAGNWLKDKTDKPYFLWIHLYEPHTPYAPPAPFNDPNLHPYDGEIAHTDHMLGQFFNLLKEKGLYEDAVVVLLSDHGEGLGDHGEVEHGLFTWRETIHVPLFIKTPGQSQAGRRVPQSVALTDLFPTLLEILQISSPKTDGQALLSGARLTDRPLYSEAMTGELFYGWHASRSVVRNNLHYMEGHETMLYDLDQDFEETNNLYGTTPTPEPVTQLMDAMTGGEQSVGAISDEDKALLESLGYTGGFEMGGDARSLSVDAFLDAFNSVKTARSLIDQNKPNQAETLLREKLEAHPDMIGVRAMLTRALYLQEKYEAAAHVCREGLVQAPNHEGLLVAMTGIELALGRETEADLLARKCLTTAPVVGGRKLIPLYFEKGRYKQTEALAAMVGCHDPVFSYGWGLLSQLAQNPLGDFRRILPTLVNACQPKPQPLELSQILRFAGRGLAGLDRFEQAEPIMRATLDFAPDNGDARRELVRFLMARGKPDQAVEVVDQWVYHYPTRNNYLQAARIMEEAGVAKAAAFYRSESQKYPQSP